MHYNIKIQKYTRDSLVLLCLNEEVLNLAIRINAECGEESHRVITNGSLDVPRRCMGLVQRSKRDL